MFTLANNITIDISAEPPQYGTAGAGGGTGVGEVMETPGKLKLQGSFINLPQGVQRPTIKRITLETYMLSQMGELH
jgi:hypothetical protein